MCMLLLITVTSIKACVRIHIQVRYRLEFMYEVKTDSK
jgi:hypothetical protein